MNPDPIQITGTLLRQGPLTTTSSSLFHPPASNTARSSLPLVPPNPQAATKRKKTAAPKQKAIGYAMGDNDYLEYQHQRPHIHNGTGKHETESPPAFRIILTGFGLFGRHTHNPSDYVAQMLADRLIITASGRWLHFTTITLPVADGPVAGFADHFLNLSRKWDMVVHLGLATHTTFIRVEIAASNSKARETSRFSSSPSSHSTDASTAESTPLIKSFGPMFLPTTLPLNHLAFHKYVADHMRDPPRSWWRDAGDYYCNEIYYRSLYRIREAGLVNRRGLYTPCVFIHIPEADVISLEGSARFVVGLCEACAVAMDA